MANKQKTQFKISVSNEKLTAVRAFLEQKNITLESEFEKYFDTLFKKYVPKDVQIYIEKISQLSKKQKQTKDKNQDDTGKNHSENQHEEKKNPPQDEDEILSKDTQAEDEKSSSEDYEPPLPYDRFDTN